VKRKKLIKVSTSGIFMIENYLSTSHSSSWVLDTRCGFYICNIIQELKKSRRLYKGKVDLWVWNGSRVVALVIWTYYFTLPGRLILELNNYYFVP